MNNKGRIALSEIFILVMGIVAFGFIVGDIGRVEGAPGDYEAAMERVNNLGGSKSTLGSTPVKSPSPAKLVANSPSAATPDLIINPEAGTTPDFGMEYFFKTTGGFDLTRIIAQTAAWAVVAYAAVKMLGGLFGLDDTVTDSLALGAAAGFGVGRGTYFLARSHEVGTGFGWEGFWHGNAGAGSYGLAAGVIVAAIVIYLTYAKTKEKTYEYTCDPWQAPTGGSKCEECNKQGILPCSEYQCRSLGQACKLVNPGTGEEKCVWVNPKDVNPPVMQPWIDALLPDYKYTPDNTLSPPDRGVFIQNNNATNKCVSAFTPLRFGINIVGGGVNDQPEPAKCKIDYLGKRNFSDMDYWFGGSQLLRYNHTQIMSLPGKAAYDAENIEINNDGNYTVYVRCQDENGNFDTANFVFKFCVDAGPDTTAPVIVSTSIINGMPIAYNQSSVNLTVYVNEPADCRWDRLDVEYADSKNPMTCSKSVTNMNAQMLYKCSTVLTGLKNAEENKFYFRCKDQPTGIADSNRNTNAESYVFTLGGTIPLVINKVGPNETVRDNTDPVKVTLTAETNAGAEEGKSLCYYKNASASEDKYVQFKNSASNKHSQDLFLPEGSYNYNIKCVDLGGNSATKSTSFYVESDSEAPIVVRAYKEETNIKLITDEEAECVYDVLNCNYLFGDGIALTTLSGINHFTEWDTSKNFYVKCKDEYGNEPAPDKCSIIVQPFQIPTKA